jgi:hypothetical protein
MGFSHDPNNSGPSTLLFVLNEELRLQNKELDYVAIAIGRTAMGLKDSTKYLTFHHP